MIKGTYQEKLNYILNWAKNNQDKVKANHKKWRENHKELLRILNEDYYKHNKQKVRENSRRWAKENRAKIKLQNSTPERIIMSKARNFTKDHISLKGKCCEVCGKKSTLHRHHLYYNKPLKIMILCQKCHKDWHKKYKPIYPKI